MEREGLTGFELVVLAIGAVAAAALGAVWAGASLALLASGHPMWVPISAAAEALGQRAAHRGDPVSAWPTP